MKKGLFFKGCSLILILCLMFTMFTGCGNSQKETSSKTLSEVSSEISSEVSSAVSSAVSSTVSTTGGGGAKPAIISAFAFYKDGYPTIEWQNLEGREGWSAKVVIKDLNGKTVFTESGITANSYTVKANLTDKQRYKLFLYYSTGKKEALFGGVSENGIDIAYQKQDPSNKYYFDGGITLDTLNNYLNRAMVYCQFFQPEEDFQIVIDSIIGAGAKYIQRAACIWTPGTWEYNIKGTIKNRVDKIHALDSQVILEACIFECINKNVEKITIPEEVFKAFGLKPENRTFDLEKMIFADGSYKNQWGTGAHVPDMTQLETQMFFYHRATYFIDLGFEALHLGQANLIGKKDTNNQCWTKVIRMIQDYAKENARRHYVILDAHYPSQKFIGSDGVMLTDFNAFPMRIHVADGQKDHAPSEKEPQLCVIKPGVGDAVYKKGIKGNSPAGWYVNEYPYLIEIDNWGVSVANLNKASASYWGYDEITWFAVQPQWYRQQFFEELTKQIDSFSENGHFSVVGKRWIDSKGSPTGSNCYWALAKEGDKNFYGDLEFYKELWKKLGK